jgi:hypothetical protein
LSVTPVISRLRAFDVYEGVKTKKFLKFIKNIILRFTPYATLLYHPSPNSWNSFNRCQFWILYMCTQYFVILVFNGMPSAACKGIVLHSRAEECTYKSEKSGGDQEAW